MKKSNQKLGPGLRSRVDLVLLEVVLIAVQQDDSIIVNSLGINGSDM